MAYRKIEDAKLTAIANAIRTKLSDSVTMKPDAMPGLIGDIGTGYIPDYWRSYLASKATEIDSALSAAGDRRSAFLWYTDAHWVNNFGRSPMILKYLTKNTGMQKTFFGGDIAQEGSGEIDTLRSWQKLVEDVPNHHSVLGNHDNVVSKLPTASEKGDFFFGPERTGDVVFGTDVTDGKTYYYIDNYIENTRYICLSTGRMWVPASEIQWCINVLKSTPKDWHIVIVSHLWLNNDYDNNTGMLNPTPPDYTQSYLDMFDAYNHRLNGTTSYRSIAYDFTDADAKIEFIIGGHVHRDYDFSTTDGIPVILTECDGRGERDDNSVATQGTITENCVYAIVADYTAKKVHVINVGRGDTRSVAIPDVVFYTNWIKKSIGADGAIYNGGKGYKENYRFSNGAEVELANYYITGFIPIKTNDVLRFANMDYMKMDATSSQVQIAVYNTDFTYRTYSFHHVSSQPSSAWSPVYREDGNVKQLTFPNALGGSTAKYIRICASFINEDSVITINEEID